LDESLQLKSREDVSVKFLYVTWTIYAKKNAVNYEPSLYRPIWTHCSDGEAHMKVCEMEPACMASIATCSFTDVLLFMKTLHCSKPTCIHTTYEHTNQPQLQSKGGASHEIEW